MLPLPGLIAAALWSVSVLVLKIFVELYVPFSLITGFGLALFCEELVIIVMNASGETRLLQEASPSIGYVLLLTGFTIGCLLNVVYVILFCCWYRNLLQRSQVDRISNYVLLFVGVLSSYRFCLLAFSKIFPNPKILISESS